MEITNGQNVTGSNIRLNTNNRLHFDENGVIPEDKTGNGAGFAQYLIKAIEEVQSLKGTADDLKMKMITNPESVNIDEVLIASSKAGLSETMLKSITEKAMKAYNDILSIR